MRMALVCLLAAGVAGCASRAKPPTASQSSPAPSAAAAAPSAAPRQDVCPAERAQTEQPNPGASSFEGLAACEERAGRIVDALQHSQRSLELAIEQDDRPAMLRARDRLRGLVDRIPHITFVVSDSDVDRFAVFFDGAQVDTSALSKKFATNPGEHRVQATGYRNGRSVTFDARIGVREAELTTVTIALR